MAALSGSETSVMMARAHSYKPPGVHASGVAIPNADGSNFDDELSMQPVRSSDPLPAIRASSVRLPKAKRRRGRRRTSVPDIAASSSMPLEVSDEEEMFDRIEDVIPGNVRLALVGDGIALQDVGPASRFHNKENGTVGFIDNHRRPPNFPEISSEIQKKAVEWQNQENDRLLAWQRQPMTEFLNIVATAADRPLGELFDQSVSRGQQTADRQRQVLTGMPSTLGPGRVPQGATVEEQKVLSQTIPVPAPRATVPEILESTGAQIELPPLWTSGQTDTTAVELRNHKQLIEGNLAMLYTSDPRSTGIKWLHEHVRGSIADAQTALIGAMQALGRGDPNTLGYTAHGFRQVGLRYLWFEAENNLMKRENMQPDRLSIIKELGGDKYKEYFTKIPVMPVIVPPVTTDKINKEEIESLGRYVCAHLSEHMVPVHELIANSSRVIRTLFGNLVGTMMVAHRLGASYGGERSDALPRTLAQLNQAYLMPLASKLQRVDSQLDHVPLMMQPKVAFIKGEIDEELAAEDIRWTLHKSESGSRFVMDYPMRIMLSTRPQAPRRRRR